MSGPVRNPDEATASRWVGEMRPVRVLSGTGDGTVMDEGHVLGYIDVPSIIVLRADGTQCAWSTRLPFEVTGPATPDDEQAALIAQMRPRSARGRGVMTEPVPTDPPEWEELAGEFASQRDRTWALLQNARGAARRLTSILIANAHRLDEPFTNDPRTPWNTHVSPAINQLRAALGMRGTWPIGCACDLHGRTCEPPSELCCELCSETQHPAHADGSVCSAPDLSGTAMPTRVEIDLRVEIDRLLAEVSRLTSALSAAERERDKWMKVAVNLDVHINEVNGVVGRYMDRAERAETERDEARRAIRRVLARHATLDTLCAADQLELSRAIDG